MNQNITKKRVVIIDNAPIHTSQKFLDKIQELEEKDMFFKFLPTYSPELNIIEILWRFIKYEWLPFSAYSSFKQLVIEVENILIQIGERFKITMRIKNLLNDSLIISNNSYFSTYHLYKLSNYSLVER